MNFNWDDLKIQLEHTSRAQSSTKNGNPLVHLIYLVEGDNHKTFVKKVENVQNHAILKLKIKK